MKIAILTTFMEFNSGYSLTGIVQDQVAMLAKYGHQVDLFVNERYHGESFDGSPNVTLKKLIPFAHLIDYQSRAALSTEHVLVVEKTIAMLEKELPQYDVVFTHDLVFQGWHMPYALAIMKVARLVEGPAWLHWIHSVPSRLSDWWNISEYGSRHRLVFPNKTDQIRVAEQYRGQPWQVEVIPHIKDLRSWFDFAPETCEFIDAHPGVMQSQIVQILPASVDRLASKRVNEVILTFAKLKQRNLSVCLVVANQWTTQAKQKQEVQRYLDIAYRTGLKPMEEVIFTSEFQSPKYDAGIPKRMVRELFQCSNLFLSPTREESFGLVVPEASLAGGVLLVLNKSLQSQIEISGSTALYLDFGSFHNNFEPGAGWDAYLRDVASLISWRLEHNESVLSKTFMRMTYNMDSIFLKYYEPIMVGSRTW